MITEKHIGRAHRLRAKFFLVLGIADLATCFRLPSALVLRVRSETPVTSMKAPIGEKGKLMSCIAHFQAWRAARADIGGIQEGV